MNKSFVNISSVEYLDETGVPPDALNDGSILLQELPKPLDTILMEIPFEGFVVGQFDATAALFGVVGQHAFLELPVVVQQIEVGVVEPAVEHERVVIVDFPKTMELIVRPVSFVR